DALKALSSAELTEDKMQKIKADLKKLLKSCRSARTSTDLPRNEESQLPTCSYNKNSKFPCASDCVEIKFSSEMGRYMSATRDIKPGDVLVVEKPFASILNSENLETHCYKCLRRCEALLPCCFCSNVMYCSEECRTSSWDESHYIECSILPTLQKLEIVVTSILALRVVIMAFKTNGLKNMLKFLEAEENLEEIKEKINNTDAYYYSSVYWLVAHMDKISMRVLFEYSVCAACMLHCLETMTDFFTDFNAEQYKYEVGGLLLRHSINISINNCSVGEALVSKQNGLRDIKLISVIGNAVYVILSLVNHSCDPNAHRTCHRGDTTVLHALAPIAAGEQICFSYGFEYGTDNKEKRKSYYEAAYFFTCKCRACTEDWPTIDFLPTMDTTFICNGCKEMLPFTVMDTIKNKTVTCEKCTKVLPSQLLVNVTKCSQDYVSYLQRALTSGGESDWIELAEKIIPYLEPIYENIKQPSKQCRDIQRILKQCFDIHGNKHEL
ncbi:hypothetical protein L9F63_001502, partial [Diploptera punctata]